MQKKLLLLGTLCLALFSLCFAQSVTAKEALTASSHAMRQLDLKPFDVHKPLKRFKYDAGVTFKYPDAVRGIYVTGPSAGGERLGSLLKLVENSDLNAMVIDVKEDHGKLTFKPEGYPELEAASDNYIKDPKQLIKQLEKKGIYPIARVVVFKDSVLAKKKPELSFKEDGKVWVNGKGEAFVNPFRKEVWEYNVNIAKMAAELGFQEIQFDYVRFPEGFENKDKALEYSQGDYEDSKLDPVKRRVEAVTDFVKYAREELQGYEVDVAVDIFGYAATIPEAPGIGQNFSKISDHVDVISSMIYPSHWTSYFGIDMPDKEPYRLVNEYAKVENSVLKKLKTPPVSRPWIQDFEAPWLYGGAAVTPYGKKEVEDQIRALNENGIEEFLIWNAANRYTPGVDYTPLK